MLFRAERCLETATSARDSKRLDSYQDFDEWLERNKDKLPV
jgi:hypothetical protein